MCSYQAIGNGVGFEHHADARAQQAQIESWDQGIRVVQYQPPLGPLAGVKTDMRFEDRSRVDLL